MTIPSNGTLGNGKSVAPFTNMHPPLLSPQENYCKTCYIWILIGYVIIFGILIGSFVFFHYLKSKQERQTNKRNEGPKGIDQTRPQAAEQPQNISGK